MKIAVGSDLHVEFGSWPHLPEKETDLLIVAGDAGTATSTDNWLDKEIKPKFNGSVFLIAGNHAGYDRTPWDEINQCYRLRRSEGQLIVGATLWTDFNLYNWPIDITKRNAENGMNDYRTFATKDVRLTPDIVEAWHHEHVKWLQEVAVGADIIVTHHAPSALSINEKFKDDWRFNPCYASNLEWLVEELHPKYWIHGHMHDACEYKIGETTVICNPRGYPGQNRNWDWRYLEL